MSSFETPRADPHRDGAPRRDPRRPPAGSGSVLVLLLLAAGVLTLWWMLSPTPAVDSGAPAAGEMAAPASEERAGRGRGSPAEPPAAQANRNGVRFFHLGRLPEARERFRRAIELDPTNPEYRNNYGWALYQLGELEAARREIEQVIELDPERAVAYASLADVRAAQGDTASAIAMYERFLQLNQDPRHQRLAQEKLRELRGSR